MLTSSNNPNWRTPAWLRHALDREFGIVLDAAADRESAVVTNYLGPDSELLTDALCGVSWWDAARAAYPGASSGAIFLNPPYSRKRHIPIEPWIAQAAAEGERGTVIGVIPYSPQTQWWRTYVEGHDRTSDRNGYQATEIRKFPFRLRFDPPPDYQGPIDADTGEESAPSGANINTVVTIWKPRAGFLDPWGPFTRYWCPPEYGVAQQAQREQRKATRQARRRQA